MRAATLPAELLESWAHYVGQIRLCASGAASEITEDVTSLQLCRELLELMASATRKKIEWVSLSVTPEKLDSSGSAQQKFLSIQTELKTFYGEIKTKRLASRNAALIAEYERCIGAIAHMHNALNELRLSIAERDADRATVISRFDSAREHTEYLKRKFA